MATIEQRLDAIEARLSNLEAKNYIQAPLSKAQPVKSTPINIPADKPPHAGPPLATQLLGWGGATALVLAASYIIKLALSSGWLTPERQLGIAVLGALLMIGLGIKLRNNDRSYASLLPAGGVTVLFHSHLRCTSVLRTDRAASGAGCCHFCVSVISVALPLLSKHALCIFCGSRGLFRSIFNAQCDVGHHRLGYLLYMLECIVQCVCNMGAQQGGLSAGALYGDGWF
jgi:uncharacterized membrane protein